MQAARRGAGVKAGEIQHRLASTNRWWADREGWTAGDPDLREAARAPFSYTAGVLDDLVPGGLYVVRGPRRVGKSVAMKRAIQGLIRSGIDPRLIVHMSVEGWNEADLERLVHAGSQITPTGAARYWFLDEISGVSGRWPDRIKWLRDNDQQFRSDTVVLTGSSSSNLKESLGALAGRRGGAVDPDRVLLPMGFRSFARLAAEQAPPLDDPGPVQPGDLDHRLLKQAIYRLTPQLHTLVATWEAYLRIGGFPQAVSSYARSKDATQPWQQPELPGLAWPVSYGVDAHLLASLQEAINADAFKRARLSSIQSSELLRLLVDGLCSPTNHSRIAREINTASRTAAERLSDLREAMVVWPAHQADGDRTIPKLRAQSKTYFCDPAYTLLGGGAADFTRLSEQQLGMALLRSIERRRPSSYVDFGRLLYYRSKTNREIDFVGRDLGDIAIESKYVDGGWRGTAGRTIGASPWKGIVATRTEVDLGNPDLMAVPTAVLAWLIDS